MAAYALLGIIILVLDQISKYSLLHFLSLGQSIPIIKDIFHLTLVYNSGCAFGIFKNQRFPFVFIALAVVGFIIFYWIKESEKIKHEKLTKVALILILSGAIGNLIDRLRFSYVIDFLDFRLWPVFNLADSAISVGAILLLYTLLFSNKTQKPS